MTLYNHGRTPIVMVVNMAERYIIEPNEEIDLDTLLAILNLRKENPMAKTKAKKTAKKKTTKAKK